MKIKILSVLLALVTCFAIENARAANPCSSIPLAGTFQVTSERVEGDHIRSTVLGQITFLKVDEILYSIPGGWRLGETVFEGGNVLLNAHGEMCSAEFFDPETDISQLALIENFSEREIQVIVDESLAYKLKRLN